MFKYMATDLDEQYNCPAHLSCSFGSHET